MKNQNRRKSSDIIREEFWQRFWIGLADERVMTVRMWQCILVLETELTLPYRIVGESDYSQGCISDWKGLDLTIISKNQNTEDVSITVKLSSVCVKLLQFNQLSQYRRTRVRRSLMTRMDQVWTEKLSVECNSELSMVKYEVPMLFLIVVMVCTHHCRAHYTKRKVILNIHLSLLVYRSITISEWRPCCIGKSFFDLLNLYFQLVAAKCLIDLRVEKLPKREAEDLSRQLRMRIAPEIPEAPKEIAQLLRIGTFGQQEPTKEGEKKSVKQGRFCWVIHLRHSTWDIHWLEIGG